MKVYEAMKAKSAAMIFDPMALELLLPIMRGMRETKVAAIVAEMDPAKARALTAELAQPHEPMPAGTNNDPLTIQAGAIGGRGSGYGAAKMRVQVMLEPAEQPDQAEGQRPE